MKQRMLWAAKWLGLALLCLLVVVLLPLVGVAVECRPFSKVEPTPQADSAPAAVQQLRADLADYARREDQTYLTLPEWYIVYSADEYAAFISQNPPSHFPYFRAIGQYWQSYYAVCAETRERYAFNADYHLSLVVIGSSFTLEYLFKGLYEGTVGRVAEWISTRELTAEDAYARQVATDYGHFIHTIPWYDFPFDEKLNGLWSQTTLWGPNPLRKWERKLVLSLEYGGKAFYGRLIRQGAQTAYAPEKLEIQGWVVGLSPETLAHEPDIHVVTQINNEQGAFVAMTRYEAFTQLVPRLAQQGVRFVEIAGNDEILITALAPRDWHYDLPAGEFLFAMPVLTQPTLNRIAVKAPVPELHLIVNELTRRGMQIEHVYDY